MPTWDDVVAIGTALPAVTVSTSYRTPSLKVRDKSFARLRTEAEGGLVLMAARLTLPSGRPHDLPDRGGRVELLTIGTFARAVRLSPKALRLYDRLGLLCPAQVDPGSGYRYYAPEQLDRARLVAWLRRLGMPLAGIATVVALPSGEAAIAVAAYWRHVETGIATRRDLAATLIDHLTREGTDMTLTLRCATACDRGPARSANQDVAFADATLMAVADGSGANDDLAARAAVAALARLDVTAGDVLNVLDDAVRDAASAVRTRGPDVGTTLTALVRSGSRLALIRGRAPTQPPRTRRTRSSPRPAVSPARAPAPRPERGSQASGR